jgi:hypothetical protein
MCDLKKPTFIPAVTQETRRKKLWQIDSSFYCAILGTCLTIVDLEKVARQCKISVEPNISDYDLHRMFVSTAHSSCPSTRQLNKLLDKKYRTAINQLVKCRCPKELEVRWEQALEAGQVAGLFWAISTHPFASNELLERVYGEVHMLSHLAGASNRQDLQQLKGAKRQLQQSQQLQSEAKRAHHAQLSAKELKIKALEEEVLKLIQRAACSKKAPQQDQLELEKKLDSVARHADWAEQKLLTAEMQLTESAHKIKGLQEVLAEVQADKEAAEYALAKALELNTHERLPRGSDLNGKQIAYIGGRTSLSPHFRSLVERCNGKFSFHDGGQEDSRANLTCALNGADMVFCPIDCVSHDACLRVKRFCKQNAKTFVPLRSSGLSAFTRGLHLATAPPQDHCLSIPSTANPTQEH